MECQHELSGWGKLWRWAERLEQNDGAADKWIDQIQSTPSIVYGVCEALVFLPLWSRVKFGETILSEKTEPRAPSAWCCFQCLLLGDLWHFSYISQKLIILVHLYEVWDTSFGILPIFSRSQGSVQVEWSWRNDWFQREAINVRNLPQHGVYV